MRGRGGRTPLAGANISSRVAGGDGGREEQRVTVCVVLDILILFCLFKSLFWHPGLYVQPAGMVTYSLDY